MLSCVQLFAAPWTVACQPSLSIGFSRQEYWCRLHFFLQGIFLSQGSNQHLLCLLYCRRIHYPLSQSSVQSLSRVQLFATPWIKACQASLSITNSRSLPKLVSIELVMSSSYLIFCCPLLLLPPIPPSIRVFSNESTLHIRWPKYWSFSFKISPSNENPGLISFRMDWLDCLAVQGTLKSLLQHHNSKASILWCSTFFTVQLSPPYMTTGKSIALTRRTFVGKIMSLLFNMLSRLVITFLPRSKCLLISWLQSANLRYHQMKNTTENSFLVFFFLGNEADSAHLTPSWLSS